MLISLCIQTSIFSFLYSFFLFKQYFYKQCHNETGIKKLLKVKQYLACELLLFENYSLSSFTLLSYCWWLLREIIRLHAYDINRARPTIMFIIFWDFLILEQIFLSPSVHQSVIINNKLAYTSSLTSYQTT